MNKYVIIALVWLVSIAGVGAWQYRSGVNSQKVADQEKFDQINRDVEEMNRQANTAFRIVQTENARISKERDLAKTALLKEKQSNVEAINAIRAGYANVGLRYSAKDAGLGNGGNSAVSGERNAAGNSGAAEYELPAAITNDLRELAYQCDALNADYKLLYDWANSSQKAQ